MSTEGFGRVGFSSHVIGRCREENSENIAINADFERYSSHRRKRIWMAQKSTTIQNVKFVFSLDIATADSLEVVVNL